MGREDRRTDRRPARPHSLDEAALAHVTGGTLPPDFGQAGQTPEEVLAAILQQRAGVLEDQIHGQVAEISERNDWLQDAGSVLQELRNDRPADAQAENPYGTFVDHAGVTQDVKHWLEESGIAVPDAGNDGDGTAAEFAAAIANLKLGMDAASAQAQVEMLRLQRLLDQRAQAADELGGLR